MSIIRELARLGNKIDSASTGEFLSKGSNTGSFDAISYTSITGKPTILDSALSSQLIDSSYVQLRQTVSGGGLDSALTTQLIDSSYVSARAGEASSGYQMYEYTATQGQTTFQDSDLSGNVLSYTSGGALVFYNGVLMGPDDITATSGSSVVLASGADSGSHVSIAKWSVGDGGGSSLIDAGPRGTFSGGFDGNATNMIEYWTIQTTGNASDFGDLTAARLYPCGSSNGTVKFVIGGNISNNRTQSIDKFTIATLGNASDHGDMIAAAEEPAACCDGTYMVVAMGTNGNNTVINDIERFTTATGGNASDHGDLTAVKRYTGNGISNGTIGIYAGGYNGSSWVDIIDQVVLATAGNATDFGDCTSAGGQSSGCSNHTRGVFMKTSSNGNGSNVLEYITIAVAGNATDFGDLLDQKSGSGSCADLEDRGMWVGGNDPFTSPYRLNQMDYVTISNAGNATDFGDLSVARSASVACGSGAAA